jgi:hypothetical protein
MARTKKDGEVRLDTAGEKAMNREENLCAAACTTATPKIANKGENKGCKGNGKAKQTIEKKENPTRKSSSLARWEAGWQTWKR